MAFNLTGLGVVSTTGAIGNGPKTVRKVYHYVTNDDASTVQATGYFNSIWDQFSIGDVMLASLDLDGTPVFKAYMITAASASGVTIALQTTT